MSLTEADKIARKGVITGSRIARILNRSPYGGPLSVFLEMTEDQLPEKDLEKANPQFKRGRILEPAVLSWHEEDAGCVLTRNIGTVIHPELPHIGATPDAIATYPSGERRPVEAKTVDWQKRADWGEEGTDQIPVHYVCQGIFEAGVTGLRTTDVPALLGLDDFRRYAVRFDADLFGMMVDEATKFKRDHLDTGRPPPVDGSGAAGEWLDKRYQEKSLTLVAHPEADLLMERLRVYRREIKSLGILEEQAVQKLQELMAEADAMVGAGWSLTWRRPKGSARLDMKALLAEIDPPQDLIQKHTRITSQKRTFRPTWSEDK